MIAAAARAASNGPGSSTSPPASSVWIGEPQRRAVVQRREHQVPVGRLEAPELDLLGGQARGRRPRPGRRTTRPCAGPSSPTCSASAGPAARRRARPRRRRQQPRRGRRPRSRAGSASSASAARSAAGSPGSRTTGTMPVRSAPSTAASSAGEAAADTSSRSPAPQPARRPAPRPPAAGRARCRRCVTTGTSVMPGAPRSSVALDPALGAQLGQRRPGRLRRGRPHLAAGTSA